MRLKKLKINLWNQGRSKKTPKLYLTILACFWFFLKKNDFTQKGTTTESSKNGAEEQRLTAAGDRLEKVVAPTLEAAENVEGGRLSPVKPLGKNKKNTRKPSAYYRNHYLCKKVLGVHEGLDMF